MLASMTVAGLGMVGCGQKKEAKPVKAQQMAVEGDADMSDDELLSVLDMLEDTDMEDLTSEDEEEALDELEDELEEELAGDSMDLDMDDVDMDDIFKGMSAEEIADAEKEAMAELAELIAREQEKNTQMAGVGPDLFDPAFDFEGMSPEDRASLLAWHENAISFAQQELETAARESKELGFENIVFAANSAEIPASQRAILASNIDIARAAIESDHDVVLVGHAEESAANPVQLSQDRAAALREAFIAAGLDENRLHATGYGAVLMNDSAGAIAECLVC